ncbi:hypothetical protein DRH29_03125, partial [candidate division Kazan bacterium]
VYTIIYTIIYYVIASLPVGRQALAWQSRCLRDCFVNHRLFAMTAKENALHLPKPILRHMK